MTTKLQTHAIRHPELVSGSVRGEWSEKARGERSDKARGEMLKQVQHDQGGEQHDKEGYSKKTANNH